MTSEDWHGTRIKFVSTVNERVLDEGTDPDFVFTYVDIGNVTQGQIDLPDAPTTFSDSPSRARRLVRAGDTVVSTVRTYLRAVATVPEVDEVLVFSTGFAVLRPNHIVESRFLSWYLQGDEFVSRIEAASTGVSYPAITAAALASMGLRLPPPDLQRAIADYLDRETAQIDTLIQEQQRLIDLLREWRQAAIDVEIDNVDAPHGQLRRAIEFLTSGSRGWGEYYADQGSRFLRIGNLSRHTLRLRGEIQRIALPDGTTEGERTRLELDDLLFSITAYLGSVAVADTDWAGGYVSQHVALCRLRSDILDSRFVGWSMLSTHGQDQLKIGAVGGTKVQLALDDIRELIVRFPPIQEQRRVAEQLTRQIERIDQLIAEAERFIELSKERRAALITAAVTGQIDVSQAA